MKKHEIFSQYRHPVMSSTRIKGRSVVDKSGYIPFHEQIKNLRAAGTRLEEWKRSMYTNEYEEENWEVSPLNRKDFDEFMAHDLSRSLTVKKILSEKAKAELEAAKAEEVKVDSVKTENKANEASASQESVPKV